MFVLCFTLLSSLGLLALMLMRLSGCIEAQMNLNGSHCSLIIEIRHSLGQINTNVVIEGPEWKNHSYIEITRRQFPAGTQSSKRTLARIMKEESLLSSWPGKIQIETMMTNWRNMTMMLRFLFLEKVEWKTVIGGTDAMTTGLACGAMWALKGLLISQASFQSSLRTVDIMVAPDFSRPGVESRFNCIFKMRIVHIIFVKAYILVMKSKVRHQNRK